MRIQYASGAAVAGGVLIEAGVKAVVTSLFLVAGGDTIVTITNANGDANTGIPPIPLTAAAGAQIILPPCNEGWGYSLSGLKIVSSQAVSIAGWINFRQG